MKALKFRLKGNTAFFKQPDVNSYLYFTYGNIHKPALLGMLGAVSGYKGYNQLALENVDKKEKKKTPEYYDKLKDLKFAIVPKNEKGYIPRKIQKFNNSVGYASKEQGGNLIVSEQWLENPEWEILMLLDSPEAEEAAQRILDKRYVYLPYLGKNDHAADIDHASIVDLEEPKEKDKIRLASLYPEKEAELAKLSRKERKENEGKKEFFYEESLPIDIDPENSQYKKSMQALTNQPIDASKLKNVYTDGKDNYYFQ